ncbi:MAG: GNAT family N-acetyltransferase [Candidatus Rokuibacteriota bacterium]
MAGHLRVTVVDDEPGFDGLREDWDRLLGRSRSATPFLTWEWARAWWTAYGGGARLWILKITQNEHLIALAPFYRARVVRAGLSYRALYFIGDNSNDSDYLDVIAAEGDEKSAVAALGAFLARQRSAWSLLFLNEVPRSSPNLSLIRAIAETEGWRWHESEVPCTIASLPSTWSEYLGHLRPRMRTKVRSLCRELEAGHDVQFVREEAGADLDARLESLFELHTKRWLEDGQPGVFGSGAKRRFYREMSERFLSRGWLRLYSLRVDGSFVAHQLCFQYGSTMFLLQEGYDPRWTESGVGNVLRVYVLRDCIERGLVTYDFLGGVTTHKLSWGGSVKESVRVAIGRPTLRNRLYFELPDALAAARRGLERVLPAPAMQWVRRLAAGRLTGQAPPRTLG